MWDRARTKARSRQRRPLRTAQEDSDDAELTRGIVQAVVDESDHTHKAVARQNRMTSASATLEEALREGERGAEEEAPQSKDEPQQPRGLTLDEVRELLMRD